MQAILESGMRIPEDVAIVWFDILPMAQVVDPPLTTINAPQAYMGELATLRLVARIENPKLPVVKTVVLTSLVDRNSC